MKIPLSFKAGISASWDSSNGESKLVVLCLSFMNLELRTAMFSKVALRTLRSLSRRVCLNGIHSFSYSFVYSFPYLRSYRPS
ncbi:hypothetical protein R6Q59_014329 [Mikania micrantha]